MEAATLSRSQAVPASVAKMQAKVLLLCTAGLCKDPHVPVPGASHSHNVIHKRYVTALQAARLAAELNLAREGFDTTGKPHPFINKRTQSGVAESILKKFTCDMPPVF
jgi:hypothetical protein